MNAVGRLLFRTVSLSNVDAAMPPAVLWAPNIYTLEEKADTAVICSGKDANVAVPGTLVVRAEHT